MESFEILLKTKGFGYEDKHSKIIQTRLQVCRI